jgi:hypothetical protein
VQGDPALRYHDFETDASIRLGQTIAVDSGIQRQTTTSGSAQEISSDKQNTGSASKKVCRIVEEIQTLLIVTADLVPQK